MMRNAALMVCLVCALGTLAPIASGHAPTQVDLSYDHSTQMLTVTITHIVVNPSTHYVKRVEISRNGLPYSEETYDSQPNTQTFEYEYPVSGANGDVISVLAECSISGSTTAEVTVVGPVSWMELFVNPQMETVEMGAEQEFTVNIYSEDDSMPVDGATLTVTGWIGTVSEVEALALGGYRFVYTAPELDIEDIEVLNVTAAKNGFHTEYLEFDFDVVFPGSGDRKLIVEFEDVIYAIDEGDTAELLVKVLYEDQYMDVDDIDATCTVGTLTEQKVAPGRFRLSFKAGQVDVDTTGSVKVVARKDGYLSGERSMQFTVKEGGGTGQDNGDGGGTPYLLWAGIGALVMAIVLALVLFLRWRRKGKGGGKKRAGNGEKGGGERVAGLELP